MADGRVDVEWSAEEVKQLQEAPKVIEQRVPDLPLTPEEKQGMVKMGPRSVAFVEGALDHAESNPGLVPAAVINVAAWRRDFQFARTAQPLLVAWEGGRDRLDRAATVAGSEAMTAALIFYGILQGLQAKVGGQDAILGDLGRRFQRAKAADQGEDKPQP